MRMLKITAILVCLLLLTSSIPPLYPAKAMNETVSISTANLNVREGPGLSYPVVGKVDKGESYPVLQQEGDWLELRLSQGKKGWVAEWFTEPEKSSNQVSGSQESIGTVIADTLRVREEAGTNYPVVGSLSQGDTITIENEEDDWLKIRHSSLEGWISKEFVRFASQQSSNGTKAVTTDSLNIRQHPSTNGEVIGRLDQGEIVNVTAEKNGWAKITLNGEEAWISSQYLRFNSNLSDEETNVNVQTKKVGQAVVTATSLNVRDQGTLNGEVIGAITKGQIVTILEEQNNWLKIEYGLGEVGWAASWFFTKEDTETEQTVSQVENQHVTIATDGTNIRSAPDVQSEVIQHADQGETFEIAEQIEDWYEIILDNGEKGFVAGWIVSNSGSPAQIQRPSSRTPNVKDKTIIIDPGHGGKDVGTTGARGTFEKTLTLETANLLYDKLKATGANVYMTRTSDTYISLASRVAFAHHHNADAFVSLHYDSTLDRSVRGITSYYYHDDELAKAIHTSIINRTRLNDRDVRGGDYYVIRENRQNSALIELGYLSNPTEENIVTSGSYQQAVATGLFEGISTYFNQN